MGRRKSRYPRENIKRQKYNKVRKDELSPTEDNDRKKKQDVNYQSARVSQVKTEKSGDEKIIDFIEKYGATISIICVIVGAIFWASYLQYDVNAAKEDISENETDIKSSTKRIEEIEKKQISVEKDIQYIKKDLVKIEKKSISIPTTNTNLANKASKRTK